MKYLKVIWFHAYNDEPKTLYHEIDDNGLEQRKVEIYPDNSFGVASIDYSFGGTELSTEKIPDVNEINSDTQFLATEIDKDTFEERWSDCFNILK